MRASGSYKREQRSGRVNHAEGKDLKRKREKKEPFVISNKMITHYLFFECLELINHGQNDFEKPLHLPTVKTILNNVQRLTNEIPKSLGWRL